MPAGYGPHGSPFHSGYVVTQPFGCTDFPEFRDQACAIATGGEAPWFHRGYDMVSMGDKTIYSTIDGTCIFAGFQGDGFGIRAYVKSGPFLVIYPHMSRVLVAAGQPVAWGQPLGTEGSTGYSTGSHLHYEIHINGAWVNPVPYLNR
jgi:murein DD-endopeptidase MepM/ murein hydrolase activator NlpD